jgi:predicted lipoprotein with Yx(FWY)xxD motif
MSRSWKFAGLTLTVLIVAAACNKQKSAAADTTATPPAVVVADPAAGVAVAVPADAPVELEVAAPPGHPVFLTDASGRAVYVLNDASGKAVVCTGDCLKSFTPVAGTAAPAKDNTQMSASLGGSTTDSSGKKQATVNGQPLYYYTGDAAKGDTKGEGKKAGGATASLVSPTGTKVAKK